MFEGVEEEKGTAEDEFGAFDIDCCRSHVVAFAMGTANLVGGASFLFSVAVGRIGEVNKAAMCFPFVHVCVKKQLDLIIVQHDES